MNLRQGFKDELFFLSNMSKYSIRMDLNNITENKREYFQKHFTFDEIIYPATENLYQALKNKFIAGRYDFRFLNPFESKKRGNMIPSSDLRPNWSKDRLIAMELVIDLKFNIHIDLANKLINIPDELLVEWNTRGDIFWGRCINTNRGENNLGEIIKRKKYELIEEKNGKN